MAPSSSDPHPPQPEGQHARAAAKRQSRQHHRTHRAWRRRGGGRTTGPIGHGGVGGGRVTRRNGGVPVPTEARHGNITHGGRGGSARISGRHGLVVRPTTPLRIANVIGGARSKQRLVLGQGKPLVSSPAPGDLAEAINRSIASDANGRRGDPAQRGIGHRRIGVQMLGHSPPGSGGRLLGPVVAVRRGRIRGRRIGTCPHSRLTTAARPRGLATPTLAVATPPRGANPPLPWGACTCGLRRTKRHPSDRQGPGRAPDGRPHQ